MYRPYGIIPPIITPFNADGSVNYESLAQMSKFLLDSGVHGLFPFGTTGEFYAVDDGEFVKALETVRDAEGYPAVIVTYTWTNNSEATASAMVMLLERAYQGERRLEAAQLGQRAGYDAHSAARNVQPGGSATVQRAYRLAEEGGTVTYTVSEFLSHTKNAVVKEFDLDGPGR